MDAIRLNRIKSLALRSYFRDCAKQGDELGPALLADPSPRTLRLDAALPADYQAGWLAALDEIFASQDCGAEARTRTPDGVTTNFEVGWSFAMEKHNHF